MAEGHRNSLGVSEEPAAGSPSPLPVQSSARKPAVEYSDVLADDILTEISDGRTLNEICERPDMPSRSSVYRWLRDNDDFQKRYLSAVEIRAHSRADEISEINRKLAAGTLPPAEARVISDNLRWLMAKENPRKFGDRVTQEITGANGKDLFRERPMDLKETARWIAFTLTAAEKELNKEAEAQLTEIAGRLP